MQTFFKSPRAAFRTSEVGGLLAVLGFPVSISVSQAGLFFALLGWVWFRRLVPPGSPVPDGTWSLDFRFPVELRVGTGIYASLLLALTINVLLSPRVEWMARIRSGFSGELKDSVLMTMAFWVLAYTGAEQGRRRLYKTLQIVAWVLVLSGAVAVFSKFRLARFPYHLVHGWVATPAARYQHFSGTLFAQTRWPLHLYMPIGFMGTHLTFAALLSFVFPFLLLRVAHPLVSNVRSVLQPALLRRLVLLAVATAVLLLNNGRSAILGLSGALALAFYFFSRTHWRSRLRIVGAVLLVCGLSIGLLATISPRTGSRFGQVIAAVFGGGKHTDWQRIFVWQGTLDIVSRNPVFGVGPGAYGREIENAILRFSQEKPRLWYAYALIQRGHAHNDPFHLLAVGGPLPLLFYLLLLILLVRRMLLPARTIQGEYWKWGPLVVFAGGLYQCYFQDAEVLLPFWLLVGVLLNATEVQPASAGSLLDER